MQTKPKIPAVQPIVSEPLIKGDIEILQRLFEEQYRDKLEPIFDGSGRGRNGEKDGWIHGLSMYRPDVTTMNQTWLDAIEQIRHPGQEIFQVMFNRLAASGRLARHVDGPPYHDRYHLPLISSGSTYRQDYTPPRVTTVFVNMIAGFWYGPISYWVPHSVTVNPVGERVVMAVDLEPLTQ